jgi:argininosuccinate synthase
MAKSSGQSGANENKTEGGKVLLVYSGGLDTSICIPLMREEYGYKDVITVTVDVGQSRAEIEQAEAKAKIMGTEHYTVDAKDEFTEKFCWSAVKANGDYQGYPMSTSIARPLIAAKAVEYAKKLGVTSFAHGCTGKGNDQYRIEFGIRTLMPEATIHAPVRERNMTRSWEIEYAKAKNVPIQQSLEKIWSIDENLWGRSIEGGRLEEPDFAPPEEIFQWTKSGSETPTVASRVTLTFKDGVPVKINGEGGSPASLVLKLNKMAGDHGIGRVDIMEDRMMGLKVRENYECPASTVILKAHKALENLVLTRDEIRFKILIDQEWSRMAYEGLWWDPLKEDLEAFINHTQKRVSGEVTMSFFKGQATILGRNSSWAMYSEDLASFDTTTFDQRESTGSVKNFGLQSRMYFQLLKKHEASK